MPDPSWRGRWAAANWPSELPNESELELNQGMTWGLAGPAGLVSKAITIRAVHYILDGDHMDVNS